jgi:hypothetical protein
LHVQGLMAEPLAAAVPAVARRREDLPRGLAPGEVKRLLDSCDRCTAVDGRSCSTAVRRLVPSPLPWRSGATAVRPRAAMRSLSPTRTAATKRPPTRSDRVAAHRTPPNHERTPAIARLPRSVRGRSNLCPSPDQDHELRFSARSPSAVGAAGTGVEAVKGQLPGQHGCPRGRAPGCRSLKPSRSPPQSGQARGERRAHNERAAAGPQNNSVDQNRDKPQQTTSNNDPSARQGDRQTPCKQPPSQTRRQSLHTREVAGSSPAVPITDLQGFLGCWWLLATSDRPPWPRAWPRCAPTAQ